MVAEGGGTVSLHQSGVDDGLFRRAMAWLDAPWVRQLETAMTAKTGRPRVHSVSAILGLLAIAALETPGELFLSRAAAVTKRLSLAQMHRLDIVAPGIVTKRQVSRVLADVELAIAGRIDKATGEVLVTPRLDIDFADLLTAIVSSVIPASIPGSVAQSLDSTDLEAHAKRQSRAKHADVPKDSLPPGDYLASESTSIRAGFPKRGADGRWQHSLDPDAREGYRAGKNLGRKTTVLGWDMHLCVDTAVEGGDYRPPLIRGMSIAPAGDCKGAAGVAAIDAVSRSGIKIEQILADRGYSYLLAEKWAYKLSDREIEQVIDLHTNQRGIGPGPIPGTIYLDGGLFAASLPNRLRNLRVPTFAMTSEEKAALAREYDERAFYAYFPMGAKPNFNSRTWRYRGPAKRGVLRCPNVPSSLRLRVDLNRTTSCEPGTACGCGGTVTLGPDDKFQTRQRYLWGTTKWVASYGRRNAVESANALIHNHYARLIRGSIRVRGTVKNGFLAAIIISTVNIALLGAVYDFDIGSPPPVGTVPVARPSVSHAKHRKPRLFRRPKPKTRT